MSTEASSKASSPRSIRNLSLGAQLLCRVMATGWFDLDAIARELVVPVATVQRYLNGTEPLPLERQLCLALFVIDHVPPLARHGRRLRGHVHAAIAFQSSETEVHTGPSPRVRFR